MPRNEASSSVSIIYDINRERRFAGSEEGGILISMVWKGEGSNAGSCDGKSSQAFLPSLFSVQKHLPVTPYLYTFTALQLYS